MELRSSEISSLIYHDIFDYPLTSIELKKWELNSKITIKTKKDVIKFKNFYLLKGRKDIVNKRTKREKFSKRKLKIAKKAVKILSIISTIKLIGLTGALAMNNADSNSDIDLLIITKKNTLWRTRLFSYFLLFINGFKIRKPNNKKQKDRLCLNMWLDKDNLVWRKKERNIYSAHELAQVYPLMNKDKTHEKFLKENYWILDYWPNSVEIESKPKYFKKQVSENVSIFENLVYFLQYMYMKKKITREVVTKTRAVFHPNDWGKIVISKLTT